MSGINLCKEIKIKTTAQKRRDSKKEYRTTFLVPALLLLLLERVDFLKGLFWMVYHPELSLYSNPPHVFAHNVPATRLGVQSVSKSGDGVKS